MSKQIYILTKLYNVNDRIASLELCNYLDNKINSGELPGFNACFLPFRDSNEKVKDLENKTLEIFKMDCNTIQKSDVILGFFDGPSYDSGESFELGYAFAKGIPIILLTSDYFKIFHNAKIYSISLLASAIAKIIHVRTNSKDGLTYADSLNDIKKQIYGILLDELNKQTSNDPQTTIISKTEKRYDFFIDNGFTMSEARKLVLQKIIDIFDKKNCSYYICTADDMANAEHVTKKINQSENVLLFGDDFEVDVDTSIIQGIAYGLEKSIFLYSSTSIALFQTEDFILYKNPMIEHSATRIIHHINELYNI